MRHVYLCAVVTFVAAAASGTLHASPLFSDDFSIGTEPDPARWTQTEDALCNVDISNGILYTDFTGQNSPRHARADSKAISLPSGWTEITLTGQWAFPTQGLGEAIIRLGDPDNSSTFVQATYANWPNKLWRASYTGTGAAEEVNRPTLPTTLTDFAMTVTPTSWSFATEGGSINKTYATTCMAGLDEIQIRVGGWEHSTVQNVAVFDNIVLTPEPATFTILALGGVGLALRRKR